MSVERIRADKRELAANIAATIAALTISAGFAIAAVVALFTKGAAAAVALALLAVVFWHARPGPSERLDRHTGR